MACWLASLAGLALLLTMLPGTGSVARAQDEEGTGGAGASPQVVCQEYCNPRQMRRPGNRLVFTGDAAMLDDERLRLLWTIHKHGFEVGAFESWPTLKPGTKSTDELAEYPSELIATTHGLELVTVERTQDTLELEIEGLEPGLAYRWRLDMQPVATWQEGPTIVCIAPVCPADYVDHPVPLPKSSSTSSPATAPSSNPGALPAPSPDEAGPSQEGSPEPSGTTPPPPTRAVQEDPAVRGGGR